MSIDTSFMDRRRTQLVEEGKILVPLNDEAMAQLEEDITITHEFEVYDSNQIQELMRDLLSQNRRAMSEWEEWDMPVGIIE